MAAVRAGKITPGRAATWAKWIADGGDPATLAATAAAAGPRGPLNEREAATLLQALDQHLPMPRGTAAARRTLGGQTDGDELAIYADIYGHTGDGPAGQAAVNAHFAEQALARRERAAAAWESVPEEDLYDLLYTQRSQD